MKYKVFLFSVYLNVKKCDNSRMDSHTLIYTYLRNVKCITYEYVCTAHTYVKV